MIGYFLCFMLGLEVLVAAYGAAVGARGVFVCGVVLIFSTFVLLVRELGN